MVSSYNQDSVTRALKPIFMVGFPRTGSTLVRNVMARHPKLYGLLAETHYLREYKHRYGEHVSTPLSVAESLLMHAKYLKEFVPPEIVRSAFAKADSMPLTEFFNKFFALVQAEHKGLRLLLKYPAMVLDLDFLLEIFPDMYLIQTVRDPRAAISSHRVRWPRRCVRDLCNMWNGSLDLCSHWVKEHPNVPYVEIRYEDIVMRPQLTFQNICNSLDIDFNDVLLEECYDPSRMDKWRKTISANDVRLIETVCAKEMDRLGYKPSGKAAEGMLGYVSYLNRQWLFWTFFRFGRFTKRLLANRKP
jgi:hypothetical protein